MCQITFGSQGNHWTDNLSDLMQVSHYFIVNLLSLYCTATLSRMVTLEAYVPSTQYIVTSIMWLGDAGT